MIQLPRKKLKKEDDKKNLNEESTEEATEEGTAKDRKTFSYTVVRSLTRRNINFRWNVIEKGHHKVEREYEISCSKIVIVAKKLYIGQHILITPLEKSKRLFNDQGFNIYLKKELYQYTDSIKARGVILTLLWLSNEQKRKGVVVISTGNFGFIVCYYGRKFCIPVTVVIPESKSYEEKELCDKFELESSKIVVCDGGRNMSEAHNIALNIAKTKGLVYLDGNDHPNMIIGQATLGYEILQQEFNIDAVLLPTTTDSCSLTMGIATVIKGLRPNTKIIEVRSAVPDIIFQDVRNLTNLTNELEILVKEYTVCPLTNLPNYLIDLIIPVNKRLICKAYKYLLESEGYKDLHAAIAIAAIYSGQLNELKGKRVVIPLYGRMDSNENLRLLLDEELLRLDVSLDSHDHLSTSRE